MPYPPPNTEQIGTLDAECRIAVKVLDVILLMKHKESSIYQQIGLERSLFAGKLGLCTIFPRFAPDR